MDLKRIDKNNIVLDDVDNINENWDDIELEFSRVDSDLQRLEQSRIKRYGVRRKLGATSASMERIGDAVGLVANADTSLSSYNNVVNDFDNIYPWSNMRPCKITNEGRVVYESYPDYEDVDGDWMVEIPEFYIKHVNDGEYLEYWISEFEGKDYKKVDKFYIAQFKTSEGHFSKPFTPPLVFNPLDVFRDGARSKGDGWQVWDMLGHYVLRTLYQVEFAHLDSQVKLGVGVTGVRYADDPILENSTNTNTVKVTNTVGGYFELGETVTISNSRGSASAVAHNRLITKIEDVGEGFSEITVDGEPFNVTTSAKIYSVGQHTGKTLNLTSSSGQSTGRSGRQSITYRGVEDIFGNVYDWVDGVLINDRRSYICLDPSKYSNSLTDDYIKVNYVNLDSDTWVTEMGYDDTYKHVEFPIKGGAGSSTGYADHYYQNTGLRAPRFGGNFNNGSYAGLFCWNLSSAPSYAKVHIGARLLYKVP